MIKMRKPLYLLISIVLTQTNPITSVDCAGSIPNYIPRSASVNSARELFGWTEEINRYRPGQCDNYWALTTTFEYEQTFRSDNITKALLGTNCLLNLCDESSFKVSGSRVSGRGATDWLADYFGLPTDFESIVKLKPQIKNYLVDFNFYLGLDSVHKGFYFRVHAPVEHSSWKLNYTEQINNFGSNGYESGYFSDGPISRDALLNGFSQYVQGQAPELIRGLLLNRSCTNASATITATNLTIFEPLAYSKWAKDDCNHHSKTKLSDIVWALGWNSFQCPNYHLGFNIRGALPTGNRPSSEFFFEPIIGNGHHWELGAGLTSHYTFWNSCDNDNSIGMYVDVNVTHLFADKQCRVFDLKGRCNSRYMLAVNLAQPVENLYGQVTTLTAVAPNSQFKYHIAPVANLTKEAVRVSVNAQVDATVLFNFRSGCGAWSVDLGYNLWFKSAEKFNFNNCQSSELRSNNTHWALKGDAQLFGYTVQNFATCCVTPTIITGCTGTVPFVPSFAGLVGPLQAFGDIVALSPSQHCATIHVGQNNYSGANPNSGGINGVRPTRNPGVDNAALAQNGPSTGSASAIVDRYNPLAGGLQMNTSLNPIFLSWDDVDVDGAAIKGLSNTLFFNANYYLQEYSDCFTSYVSFGGKVELGLHQSSNDCNTTACNTTATPCIFTCSKTPLCAPTSWGIWFKGGLSFN